ncbi:MAG: NAD-dependent epimerase/dehydratase family protein [Dehalococcoidia bacterium]
MSRALVVGGTGPTGPHIVNALLADGHDVVIFHTGAHEVEFAGEVEDRHGDARDPESIAAVLGDERWDVAVCTSGRLRALAEHLTGKTDRLVGITGQPVYAGSTRPTPTGKMPLPVPEGAERQFDAEGYIGRVAVGEDALFEQHASGDFEAVIVRYPGIFGPRAPINHEWAVVRRIIDERPFMLMPHDGTSYFQRGYAENVGRLVYLAATRPEAAGEAFNAGDERVLSSLHVAEVIAGELGSDIEFIGVPAGLCRGVYPLAEKSSIVLDLSKARELLGYRDVVDVEAATRLTARWLVDHPPDEDDLRPGGHGRFDYEREDRIAAVWRESYEAAKSRLE